MKIRLKPTNDERCTDLIIKLINNADRFPPFGNTWQPNKQQICKHAQHVHISVRIYIPIVIEKRMVIEKMISIL